MGGLEAQSCHCRPWKGREVMVALKPELSEFNGRLTIRRDEIPDDRLVTLLVPHLALTLELWCLEDPISHLSSSRSLFFSEVTPDIAMPLSRALSRPAAVFQIRSRAGQRPCPHIARFAPNSGCIAPHDEMISG